MQFTVADFTSPFPFPYYALIYLPAASATAAPITAAQHLSLIEGSMFLQQRQGCRQGAPVAGEQWQLQPLKEPVAARTRPSSWDLSG